MHGMSVLGILVAVASVALSGAKPEAPRQVADRIIVICPTSTGPCYSFHCDDDGNHCDAVGVSRRPGNA